MKKILLCLLLSPLFNARVQAQDMPVIKFVNNDSVYDFGAIKMGDMPRYQFEIKNTGNVPLTIASIKSKNDDLKFTWPEKPLKPHKKACIYVTYNPKDHAAIGSFSNDVFITSNATQQPYAYMHISGAVIPSPGAPVAPAAESNVSIVPGSTLFYGDPAVK